MQHSSYQKMENNWSDRVILKNVVPLNKEIGRGAYGRVFAVKYCGLVCAAKEIHSILLEAQDEERESVIQSFLLECWHCSELRHPNIVQFMGVYYNEPNGDQLNLPIMVMELMDHSLTSLVDKEENVEMKTKVSILHDVCLGLSYLHSQNEPIVHRDLSPNNVLLTPHMVAKISDLGIARVLKTSTTDSRRTRSKLTKAPGTLDFMAPETLYDNPTYDTSIDVFSFAGIALHLMCEEWPTPSHPTQMDTRTGSLIAFTEVERRQKYFDRVSGEISTALKPLLKSCLDNNPSRRPPIAIVSEKIELLKNMKVEDKSKSSQSRGTAKEKPPPIQRRTVFSNSTSPGSNSIPNPNGSPVYSNSSTAVYRRSDSLPGSKSASYLNCDFSSLPKNLDGNSYSESQCNGSYDLTDCTTSLPSNITGKGYGKRPVPKPRSISVNSPPDNSSYVNTSRTTSNHNSCPPKVTKNNIEALVSQYKKATAGFTSRTAPEKVPLIPALENGKYYMKWRRCANLLFPLYAASVATDSEHVYVTGDCAEKEVLNVVFVYNIASDSWRQLPPSDHCWGVLQIVGDKLTLFGGIDYHTKTRTNRVSTFDNTTKKWGSCYPDMNDVRFRPGVATHLDYVMVAGGNKDPINVRNDIEVLNWRQCKRWMKSSITLPTPMWAFTPIISNDRLYIVGYSGEGNRTHRDAYEIPVVYITSNLGQNRHGRNYWIDLPSSSYYYSTLVPGSSPPVYVGGEDGQGVQSSNISMYDSFTDTWRCVDALSSPRAGAAVASIDKYSVIVIGGYTKGHSNTAAKLSSLPTVEIGEAELA